MLRRGFTLIELLVVVGILAVLIAILASTLGAARRAGESTACLSQMRQIGIATALYAQDNRDNFPRSTHSALAARCMPWGYALCLYLGGGTYRGPGPTWDSLFNSLYRCPSDDRRDRWSYGKNVWFELTAAETGEVMGLPSGPTFFQVWRVPRPGATILYGELGSGSMADHIMAHFWHLGGTPEVDARRHGSRCSFVLVDGHADARRFESTFNKNKGVDLWNPARRR